MSLKLLEDKYVHHRRSSGDERSSAALMVTIWLKGYMVV